MYDTGRLLDHRGTVGIFFAVGVELFFGIIVVNVLIYAVTLDFCPKTTLTGRTFSGH